MAKHRPSRPAVGKTMPGKKKLPREELKALVARSGYSGSHIAKSLGYASPPGFLRYMQETYMGDKPIPFAVIKKLIPLIRGRGDPPITIEELMAISDATSIPKSIEQAFVSAVVDDADGFLRVQYRLEAGTYVKLSQRRSLGASRIGVSRQYDAESQFVVAVADTIKGFCVAGTQLHCVAPDQFASVIGKFVVMGVAADGTDDIVELRVARVEKTGMYCMQTLLVEGPVIGVVVGAYQPM